MRKWRLSSATFRRRFAFAIIGSMTLGSVPAFAFDGTTSDPSEKIPKHFADPNQALRAGLADLKAGDADASVAALTYAAEGGQDLARWKLGEMYADGQGVPRDDLKAYHSSTSWSKITTKTSPTGERSAQFPTPSCLWASIA